MANYIYGAIQLIGGSPGALDAINGSSINNGDCAVVITTTGSYHFKLDATSGAPEDSPNIITPDNNAGTKRWIKVDDSELTTLQSTVTTHTSDNAAHGDPGGALTTHTSDNAAHGDPGGALTTHTSDKSGAHVTVQSSDPTTNDDSSSNFGNGCFIINSTSKVAFVCVDSTIGAAVWNQINTTSSDVIGISNYKNLVIKNNVTFPNTKMDITCDKVVVTDSSNNIKVLTGVSLTCDITSSGVDGLDTGTVGTFSWYHIWIIYNPTTTTTASLFSLSETAPTMPSGYTHVAKMGAVYRNSSVIVSSVQRNNKVSIPITSPVSGSNTNDVITQQDISAAVPPNAIAILGRIHTSGTGSRFVRLTATLSRLSEVQFELLQTGNGLVPYSISLVESQTFWYSYSGTGAIGVSITSYTI